MKKFVFFLALMLFQLQFTAMAASNNYNKKPAVKKQTTAKTQQVNNVKKDTEIYKQDGNDYLLKYNINDLEAAPWLNGGNRKL